MRGRTLIQRIERAEEALKAHSFTLRISELRPSRRSRPRHRTPLTNRPPAASLARRTPSRSLVSRFEPLPPNFLFGYSHSVSVRQSRKRFRF